MRASFVFLAAVLVYAVVIWLVRPAEQQTVRVIRPVIHAAPHLRGAKHAQTAPAAGMWAPPPGSNLVANPPAASLLAGAAPSPTTLHFTFGSLSMLDFLHNWKHFVDRLGLAPALVGAADAQMLKACTREGIAAVGIAPELDVWNYTRSATRASTVVQEGAAEWKYYRHHKSSFLELGLVKAAFLWELLRLGYDVLISDLDVVWINDGWERWMTYRNAARPPLPEAEMQAMADVLVSTDELDELYDAHMTWERWPWGIGWGWRSELNTGVVFWRATNGSLAFVQAWRLAMLAKRETLNTNDQFIFIQMVREAGMERVTGSAAHLNAWRTSLAAHGLLRPDVLRRIAPTTRGVSISKAGFASATPCLPEARCAPARFTVGTLPLRAFTGGHTFFMQRVANFEGHALPRAQPLTVHFTFQYSDTPDYPHGKRQRAREAGLWAADPPSYFSEGRFVRIVGPLFSAAQRVKIFKRFPEWSPQRHMALDAIQRAAIRDLMALATALNATLIMPRLFCTCDRYWGFLQNCRMPTAPTEMPMPFRCSQDALFEIKHWDDKAVRFREADFLDHPSTAREITEAAVRLIVHPTAPAAAAGSAEQRFTATLRPGAPMTEAARAVADANPDARLVEIGAPDLRRLCKWLGSAEANRAFNRRMRYVLQESSRFCPSEDNHESVQNMPHWNWQNPFTAYNCTWGFATPADYPETEAQPCAAGAAGVALVERPNSTTCARAMLCGVSVSPDGTPSMPLEKASRCNLEGYGGVDYDTFPQVTKVLEAMPGGRCPYPPLDTPGPGPGFDSTGKWVGGRGEPWSVDENVRLRENERGA